MTPISRKENLVVQDLGKETFIYDLENDKVFSLNETSAFVWNKLDGKTSVADLALELSGNFDQPANEDLVWLAIDELRKFDLLEKESLPKAMSKVKRREVIKRIGLASMIALPVISMLIAPTALQAASGGLAAACQPCVSPSDCAAPANCKPSLGGGGGSVCALNTIVGYTYGSGTNLTAISPASCNIVANSYCCSGTATFTAPFTCTCN